MSIDPKNYCDELESLLRAELRNHGLDHEQASAAAAGLIANVLLVEDKQRQAEWQEAVIQQGEESNRLHRLIAEALQGIETHMRDAAERQLWKDGGR